MLDTVEMDKPGQQYSNRMRKQVIERINSLTSTQHEEIFSIIQRRATEVAFTRNNNGVFFNMALLPDDVIADIDAFVSFCLHTKQELDEYDKRLNECKLGMDSQLQEGEQEDLMGLNIVEQVTHQSLVEHHVQDEPSTAWASLLEQQTRVDPGFQRYIATMYSEKQAKRKPNTRFYTAKKKYAKRFGGDRKDGCELSDVLYPEM